MTVEGESWPAGGDVIVKVDGSPFRPSSASSISIAAKKPGDNIDLEVVRGLERDPSQREAWAAAVRLKPPSRLAPNPWGPASAGAVGQHGARKRRARGPPACPGPRLEMLALSRERLRSLVGLSAFSAAAFRPSL